ncbi:phosphoribosylglycinamide formyltransferase [Pelagibacteraceae bacterium]|mgnify:CR=1 FL=1|jgi:phosphoribosylglycinamide formyltransferase-1|nr:phosphoribosylglycinamide formyltransferase [Pelagibacteraceae bacterium]|tara:strand:+ start:494 stop:1051 length:558 start_codon:yes stop_codon:yes gene_type:complete
MVKINTCVFISGTGSNLKYLIKNSREYNFPIKIAQVYTNKKNAPGLIYAKKYSIPFKVINLQDKLFEVKILDEIKKKKILLICLAGYMKILSKKFIKNFNGKIINIHPSLLPKYKGINTFSRILKNKEKITGCTVHHVNAELDSGNIILKKSFNILKNENEKSLRKKTQNFEYRAFSEAIIKLFR